MFEPILNCKAVTTEFWAAPSDNSAPQHHIAKAADVAATLGCCATTVKCAPSWIPAVSKESSGLVRTCSFSVTSFRNPCLNDFCTTTFSSPTVEFCGSARVSPQPLGNETSTWSIACSGSQMEPQNIESQGGRKPAKKWVYVVCVAKWFPMELI